MIQLLHAEKKLRSLTSFAQSFSEKWGKDNFFASTKETVYEWEGDTIVAENVGSVKKTLFHQFSDNKIIKLNRVLT